MISLRRVAVHNLKNIDLDLPLGELIIFCGRSGSGKSSLALDTLFAEGQRRYIETFSPAMRQLLEKIEKPKAERLDGIPPTIAVTSNVRKMGSMTVGEATELNDYLAMLFTNVGHVFCPKCSRPITADSPQTIWQMLLSEQDGRRQTADGSTEEERTLKIQIAFAPPLEKTSAEFSAIWKEQGFLRGCLLSFSEPQSEDCTVSPRHSGRISDFRLDEPIPNELYQEGIILIVDRLTLDYTEEERIIESLETAFDYGEGKCFVLLEHKTSRSNPPSVGEGVVMIPFSRTLSCGYCNIHVPPLTSKLFRTDWIRHIHLHAEINSPTMSDMLQWTIAELIHFFEETGECFYLPGR